MVAVGHSQARLLFYEFAKTNRGRARSQGRGMHAAAHSRPVPPYIVQHMPVPPAGFPCITLPIRHPHPPACRDVYLLVKPREHIADFYARTPLQFDAATGQLCAARWGPAAAAAGCHARWLAGLAGSTPAASYRHCSLLILLLHCLLHLASPPTLFLSLLQAGRGGWCGGQYSCSAGGAGSTGQPVPLRRGGGGGPCRWAG